MKPDFEQDGIQVPRRPWLLSKQYGMTFVLSQDNEIILGSATCQKLGDDLCKYIVEAVNAQPQLIPVEPKPHVEQELI